MHTYADDASTAIRWAVPRNKLLKDYYQKRTKTSPQRATATYVGMVVEKCGHACYGVHITAHLVFVLCQSVHSCTEPSLHGLDFFLEIFFDDKSCKFSDAILHHNTIKSCNYL